MSYTVVNAFRSNALSNPDSCAVKEDGERAISYRDLDLLSNRIANGLKRQGCGRGDIVAICMLPSISMVATLLGVLKAGAAYSPIDPANPPLRLNQIMDQLPKGSLIIVDEGTSEKINSEQFYKRSAKDITDDSDDMFHSDIDPDALCYVVFTSGTTGTPKSVAIKHKSWHNLLAWFRSHYRLGVNSDNLLVSAIGFDISQRSIMCPLVTGATLHLMTNRYFDPQKARKLFETEEIRTLHCAPSSLYLMIDHADSLPSLMYAFIGGEALNLNKVRGWCLARKNYLKVIHQYGVAECTDVATAYQLSQDDLKTEDAIPVGTPVANNQILILNDDLSTVRDGSIGEICIAGPGVGEGYLNNKPLTLEKFINIRVEDSETRIYRTGDFGYINQKGQLVCNGRLDNQVKIRGVRIDLGDIESALKTIDGIETAIVVVAGKDESQKLCAFFSTETEDFTVDRAALRKHLSQRLPLHMVPDTYRVIEDFPLTQNGKIDRTILRLKAG